MASASRRPPFARYARRIEAAVLVQVPNLERGDLGAAQPDLQDNREDRAIAQPGDGILRWRVAHLAPWAFTKARVKPSSRLIAGRSTSPIGLPWPGRAGRDAYRERRSPRGST